MSTIGEQRSLSDLLGGLSRDISGLFRKEVQLAKAEAQESLGKAIQGIVAMAIGGVLALGALGVLLGAAVSGLAIIFVNMGMSPEAGHALSAVIVGVIVAIVAWVMIKKGIDALKGENLWLERTAHSVSRDANVIKEKVHG